jgi:hypothetical protein
MRGAREGCLTGLAAVVIVLTIIAMVWLMVWIGQAWDKERATCLHSGGQWTRHYRSYTCVHPSPQGSP